MRPFHALTMLLTPIQNHTRIVSMSGSDDGANKSKCHVVKGIQRKGAPGPAVLGTLLRVAS